MAQAPYFKSVTPTFSIWLIRSNTTVFIPFEQEMVLHQTIDIQALGELDLEGRLAIL